MNPHLAEAVKLYEADGTDLQSLIGWHLQHGIVVCQPSGFAMCFFSNAETPTTPCEFHHSDTAFVTFCSGDMRETLGSFKDSFRYLAFQREFKGSPKVRLYCPQKFYSKLK